MNQPPMQPQQFDQQQQVPQQQLQGKQCPYCMSVINPAAIVCPVCTRDLLPEAYRPWPMWQKVFLFLFVSATGYAIVQGILGIR